MSGIAEIYNFGEAWKHLNNFRVTPVGNYIFEATIVYTSEARGVESDICAVQIIRNGISDGSIEIYSGSILQNETHHLGFSEEWQVYKHDPRNNALVVKGSSPKMGGRYRVDITPNGNKARILHS